MEGNKCWTCPLSVEVPISSATCWLEAFWWFCGFSVLSLAVNSPLRGSNCPKTKRISRPCALLCCPPPAHVGLASLISVLLFERTDSLTMKVPLWYWITAWSSTVSAPPSTPPESRLRSMVYKHVEPAFSTTTCLLKKNNNVSSLRYWLCKYDFIYCLFNILSIHCVAMFSCLSH